MAGAGSPAAERRMTVAEFLDFDDGTDTRYELVEGRPVAINPPKVRHVGVGDELDRDALRQASAALPSLHRRRCRAFRRA